MGALDALAREFHVRVRGPRNAALRLLGCNTQIVQPQSATNQKSESQKATSSRFIVGCYAGLAARVAAVLMAYRNTRAQSCDCTPMIWF